MSLGDTDAYPSGSSFLEGVSAGPERRMQDRYIAQRIGINVDRQRCHVLDISTGGVRMQAPPDSRSLGAEFKGLLVCKAGGADIRVIVRGRIVRVEGDGQTVGVQFAPMPPSHQAAVNAIIQMLERLEIEAAFEQARQPKKSPPILRFAVATAVFGATFGIAALYLTIR
ncbi:MAG: PilZ domain-containing protein [Thalassobaculaceae bacterium]|nr:PilZ domain-containing protein [Thalassobaculaceae bacterium]